MIVAGAHDEKAESLGVHRGVARRRSLSPSHWVLVGFASSGHKARYAGLEHARRRDRRRLQRRPGHRHGPTITDDSAGKISVYRPNRRTGPELTDAPRCPGVLRHRRKRGTGGVVRGRLPGPPTVPALGRRRSRRRQRRASHGRLQAEDGKATFSIDKAALLRRLRDPTRRTRRPTAARHGRVDASESGRRADASFLFSTASAARLAGGGKPRGLEGDRRQGPTPGRPSRCR